MARKIGEDNAQFQMPDGWHPAIFQGEKELPNGAAAAVFKVMIESEGALKPAGFHVDVYITEKNQNDTYKKSVVSQFFQALGLSNPVVTGKTLEFPMYNKDGGNTLPQSLTIPVMIYLKKEATERGEFMRSWAENYQYIKAWQPMASAIPAAEKPNNPW